MLDRDKFPKLLEQKTVLLTGAGGGIWKHRQHSQRETPAKLFPRRVFFLLSE